MQYWWRIPEKLRFLLVGGFNTLASQLIFYLVFWLGQRSYPQFSLFLSWSLGTCISFPTQKFLVFRSQGNWWPEYHKCLASWLLGYGINALLLRLGSLHLPLSIEIIQVLAIAITTVVTYILLKFLAFHN